MKFLITENQLKKFIENKLGVDLKDKFHVVTGMGNLPKEFRYVFNDKLILNHYILKYGPMYIIKTPEKNFLYQVQDGEVKIVDNRDTFHSERDVLKALGISPYWGITIKDLIKTYFVDM